MLLNIRKLIILMVGLVCTGNTIALEYLAPLPKQQWLVSVPLQGLKVLNSEFDVVAEIAGRYEQTQAVSLADDTVLVAAVNQNENSLDIFNWNGADLILLQRQAEPLLALEGLCLYKAPVSADIHAFLLMEHTEIEQRIIYSAVQQKPVKQSVRHLPVPDGVVACVVDSARDTLYIAEESVGVWRMSAHPESDKGREAVSLLQPFGELTDPVESLSVLEDGSLVIPQSDAETLHLFRPDGEHQIQPVKHLSEAHAMQQISGASLQVLLGDSIENLQVQSFSIAKATQNSLTRFVQIAPTSETGTMQKYGDAADDPAIWFNPAEPEKSLILGTDKKRGLAVFDLQGNEQQFLEVGRINNVDLRAGFDYQGQTMTLASASQRDNNSITLFFIDAAGQVSVAGEVATNLNEVYGLCMSQDADKHYVFINDKDGRYQQYQIHADLSGELVREFKLAGQPEGCVANDATQELFVGIEDEGIWHVSSKANTENAPQNIIKVGGNLKDDVEGMALYLTPEASYLVVSSQGNNSYALYNAVAPFHYIASFQVAANVVAGIDGASETDGLDVSSHNFGGAYSAGLLVVQDGRNVMPAEPQNFKLVAFSDILNGLNLAKAKD